VWAPYIFVHEFGHHIAGCRRVLHVGRRVSAGADRGRTVGAERDALLDPAALKWKDLLTPGVRLPTPWPKDEFERYTKEISRSARDPRREPPGSEMDALFRDEESATRRS
jgi:hypothetical protein